MPPLSNNSKVALTVGTALTCAIAIAGAAWQVSATLYSIDNRIAMIQRTLSEQWTITAQERWAAKLQWENRELHLKIPDVRAVSNGS